MRYAIRRALAALASAFSYRIWLHRYYVPIAGGTTVAGTRTTGNILDSIMEPDFADMIAELEPSKNPLTVLTRRADKQNVINSKYTWWEDQLQARFDAVNNGAGYASGAASIVVDNGAYWAADDIAYVTRTGETMRITAVSTNTLTVVRGVGSTAAALVDNDELIRTGSAAQENALDKPARSDNPVEVYNQTQIFRTPVDESGTARSTANRPSSNDWNRQLNHAGIEHYKDIEYAGLLGNRSKDTSGSAPRTTTGGFLYYANQNVTDVGGAMTEAEWFDALRPMFRYGSGTKLAMAAALPVDVVSAYPRSKLVIVQSEETFGIRVQQVNSPHGTVNFVTHWLLEGTKFGNQIWIADMANIGYRYLHGDDGSRDTHVRPDIQAPGQDGRKDEFLTECGFVVKQPLTHGRVSNITS